MHNTCQTTSVVRAILKPQPHDAIMCACVVHWLVTKGCVYPMLSVRGLRTGADAAGGLWVFWRDNGFVTDARRNVRREEYIDATSCMGDRG